MSTPNPKLFGLATAGLAATLVATPILFAPAPGHAGSPPPPDHANGVVVHVGDSFIDGGLQQTLKPKFAAEKTKYVSVGKASSYLGQWSAWPDISELYYRYHPVLFLATLGANEAKAPPESRVNAVRQIVKNMRGAPCVWVAFPTWSGMSNTLNQMIRKESAPCRYFDSDAIAAQIPRGPDKIHPTREGSVLWAEAVFKWLSAERDRSAKAYWTLKSAPPGEH